MTTESPKATPSISAPMVEPSGAGVERASGELLQPFALGGQVPERADLVLELAELHAARREEGTGIAGGGHRTHHGAASPAGAAVVRSRPPAYRPGGPTADLG